MNYELNELLGNADIVRFIKKKQKNSFAMSSDGTRCWWRNWLKHCATSLKVAGSIPDGVIEFFSLT